MTRRRLSGDNASLEPKRRGNWNWPFEISCALGEKLMGRRPRNIPPDVEN